MKVMLYAILIVAVNPALALVGWSHDSWAWTSPEYSSFYMRIVGYGGACNNVHKNNARVALPVLEHHLL